MGTSWVASPGPVRPFPVTAPAAMLPTPTGCVWGCGGRLCDSPGQKTYPYSSADDFMASEGFPGRVTPDGQRVPVPAASHPASASRPGRSPAPRPAGAAAHRPASGRWPGTARRHLPPRGCEGRGAGRGHRGAAGSSHPPLNTPLPPGKRLFIDFAGRARGPSPSPPPPLHRLPLVYRTHVGAAGALVVGRRGAVLVRREGARRGGGRQLPG